jgi:hypothetical protein
MDKDIHMDMSLSMSLLENEHIMFTYMLMYIPMYLFVFRCISIHMNVSEFVHEHVHI